MTIYIVILHYGEIENTLNCLESVSKLEKKGMKTKVILVNNDFTSEESWLLRLNRISLPPSEEDIKVINNSKNLGFAAGVNIGIKEALKDKKTDYILLLNNDTIVSPDLLVLLLKTPADIVSPVIKYKNQFGQWRYDCGGMINRWIGRTKHLELESRIRQAAGGYESGINKIDYVSGCCMFVKREVFEKIGFFDENYFMYFEDVDFCTRATRSGLQILVNPDTTIVHLKDHRYKQKDFKTIKYLIKSNYIFLRKYSGARFIFGLFYLLYLSLKLILGRKCA